MARQEDVVIKIRVDESELRRRQQLAGQRPDAGSFAVNTQANSILAAGMAGHVGSARPQLPPPSPDTANRLLIDANPKARLGVPATPRLRTGTTLRQLIGAPPPKPLGHLLGLTDDRPLVLRDPLYRRAFMDFNRAAGQIGTGAYNDIDTARLAEGVRTHNFANRGFKGAMPWVTEKELFQNIKINDALTAPPSVTRGRLATVGSLTKRTGAAALKGVGVATERGASILAKNLDRAITHLKQPTKLPFSSLSVDSLKEVAGQIGIITSAMALMATASEVGNARHEYYKKLLLTDETPNPEYIQAGFKSMVNKVSETVGNLTYNIMFDVPAVLLEGIGSIFADNPEVWGLAIDKIGMSWREGLGLTEADYNRVAEGQKAWMKSWNRLQEQVNAQSKRQSRDVAARMQGLGLSGANLDDLSDAVFKELKYPALLNAAKEFENVRPFPTARDVNPYGVDGSAPQETLEAIGGVAAGPIGWIWLATR